MEVKNRFAFPAMLTGTSAQNGTPSKRSYLAYEQKARGGVGMMTYEAATVNPAALGFGANIGRKRNVPAYKEMTDLVHKYNVKFGMQLAEPGLIGFLFAKLFNFDLEPVAPSSIEIKTALSAWDLMMPNVINNITKAGTKIRELTVDEIVKLEDTFAKGAKKVIEAGFDFVEIHSAHGTLHSSFLSPWLNKRTDDYGGSLENKCHFLGQTISKIREKIGDEPPIFVRISCDELIDDGNKVEDAIKIAKIAENLGADCIDVTQGIILRSPHGITIPNYVDRGGFIHIAEAIKKNVNVPVIGVGRIVDPKMADEFIQQGKADIIHMGRQLICDPDTPNKYFNGQLDDIRYCIGCLQACGGAICVYDAYCGPNFKELTPSSDLKNIVILGAGIAGMEAARLAKLRGHAVEIYEKSDKVGGLIPLVAAEYKKSEFINVANYLEIQLKKLGVPIHLNKILTKDDITSLKPDILILATGSDATIPVNLKEKTNILTQDEAILKSKPMGKDVVVWGLNTYWRGGVETAITLAEQGYNVKALVGSEVTVAASIMMAAGRRYWILRYLKEKNIPIYYKSKLLDVTEKGVKFLDENQKEQFIEADNLIYCGSRISNGKALRKELEGAASKIGLLGDAKKPRDIAQAMKDAQNYIRKLT